MSHPLRLLDEENAWYSKGLNFKCTECGKCCTGSPGYTWTTDEDIIAMADYLELSTKEFAQRYLRWVDGKYALLEHHKTFACIFLTDNKCAVYPVRPLQCRTYPWWQQNLKSEKAWNDAAAFCEGISIDAPLVSFPTIQRNLATQNNLDTLRDWEILN